MMTTPRRLGGVLGLLIGWGCAVVSLIGMSAAAGAAGSALSPAQFAGLHFEQHPGAALPLDARLFDENARPVTLGDYFGRPVLLVLEYLHCANLCGLTLAALVQAVDDMPLAAGQDFGVVAISIDPRETPADARRAKAEYLARAKRPQPKAWHFLTGSERDVGRIAAQIGFRALYDQATDQYAHPAGVIVATPLGSIARYFPGIEYRSADLARALTQAKAERIAAPASPLFLLCYGYDPATGKYSLMIGRLLQIAGGATAASIAFAVFLALRRERRVRGQRP
jgi:protein SCO1